jgi:hypothetical protein
MEQDFLDPRDRVYALLTLVDDCHCIKADYPRAPIDLFDDSMPHFAAVKLQ